MLTAVQIDVASHPLCLERTRINSNLYIVCVWNLGWDSYICCATLKDLKLGHDSAAVEQCLLTHAAMGDTWGSQWISLHFSLYHCSKKLAINELVDHSCTYWWQYPIVFISPETALYRYESVLEMIQIHLSLAQLISKPICPKYDLKPLCGTCMQVSQFHKNV